MTRSVALILAGGVGNRMHMAIPKQFTEVDGLSVLQYTMMAFQRHRLIDAVYVVAAPKWHMAVREQAAMAGISKLNGVATSGPTSMGSLMSGIAYIAENEDDETVVLVHDAVRPLLPQETISSNIAVCLSRGNAITAIESQESFMLTEQRHEDGDTSHTRSSNDFLLREAVLRAQTPHTFRLHELKAMRREADERGVDDAQSLFVLACRLGHTPLYAAQGSTLNFKLTVPTDIDVFRAIVHEFGPLGREDR